MSRPLRMLLLEDCQDDARLIFQELRRAGFEPIGKRVETELEFLAELDPAVDIILTDYRLPHFNALLALDRIRELGLDVPVIVLTGALGDEAAVECLKQGAYDYLLKDRLARLGPAVVLALEQKQARDARRRAEEEIKIAKEVAEAANRAKDQFLACLSHELRSPLNPVLLAVSAMLENPGTVDELRSMLVMIKDNVELEVRLIDDLLDVTRIAHGKLHLNLEAVDVHVVIRRALETCCDAIHAGLFQLALDLSAGEHHVEGDPARLQQLFWNLINNAAKFAPSGGAISIRTRNEPGPGPGATGRRLIVEVSDAGIGIDSAALPKIFRDFEQGDASIARRFGGLGLGLAISQSVAEAHGGRLTAASDGKDRGATFTLELAARAGEIHEPDAPSPALCATSGPRPLRILLVEDNRDSLRYLAWALARHRHAVRAASDLASARELAASEVFDLLISDIGLPDGTGLQLMNEIKKTHGFPGIAISGFGSEEDVRMSEAAGFAAHLTKPIQFHTLEAAMRQVASANDRDDALSWPLNERSGMAGKN